MEEIAAVDFGGIFHVARNAFHELAQQENVEGVPEETDDPERGQRVVPAEMPHDEEVGNHGDLRRNHHGGEHDAEAQVAPGPLQPRECIGNQRTGNQVAENIEDHEKGAGGGVTPEGNVLQRAAIVANALGIPCADLALPAQGQGNLHLVGPCLVFGAGRDFAIRNPEFDAVRVGGVHGPELLEGHDLRQEAADIFGARAFEAAAVPLDDEMHGVPGVVGREGDLNAEEALGLERQIEGLLNDDFALGGSGEVIDEIGLRRCGVAAVQEAGGAGDDLPELGDGAAGGEFPFLQIEAAHAHGPEREAAQDGAQDFGGERRGDALGDFGLESGVGQVPAVARHGLVEPLENAGGQDPGRFVAICDFGAKTKVEVGECGQNRGAHGRPGRVAGLVMVAPVEVRRGGCGHGAFGPEGEGAPEHFAVDLEAAAEHPDEGECKDHRAAGKQRVDQEQPRGFAHAPGRVGGVSVNRLHSGPSGWRSASGAR